MKNFIIFLALPLLFMAEGCSKFTEGYEVDPNNPTEATPALVLSSTEVALFNSYTGTLARISGILTQQLGGTANQMLDIDQYQFTSTDNSNDWDNLYTNIIQPANDLIENYGGTNPKYAAVAKIFKAMAIGIATDYWGDVPATEAGMGLVSGNYKPKYDTQEKAIAYVQTLLDEAITGLKANTDNAFTMGSDDFMFGGDAAKWINTAYILKARYANRLSNKDASGSATTALAALTNVTDAGDAKAIYGSNVTEYNQWFAFKTDRPDYLKVGAYFVNTLTANADPRLPFYAAKDANGGYSGAAPSSLNLDASEVGSYIAGTTSTPLPMVTYTEALFIKAEASLRLGNTADAATAYNAAVIHSVTEVTGAAPSAAFVTAYASATAADITLAKIMNQKYLSEFTQIEAWNDWRRTGYPAITPNADNVTGQNKIPRIMLTVNDEMLYNKANVVIVDDIFKTVWWDTAQ